MHIHPDRMNRVELGFLIETLDRYPHLYREVCDVEERIQQAWDAVDRIKRQQLDKERGGCSGDSTGDA